MMFKNILIAYDGSEHSERAAQIAGNLARSLKSVELCVVCVMEPIPTELGEPYAENLITERTLKGQELLQQAKEHIGKDLPIHDELLFGSPAESIMELANNRGCNLIIMGTRGLGGLKELLLGSQVQKVISLSDIPVLAVK